MRKQRYLGHNVQKRGLPLYDGFAGVLRWGIHLDWGAGSLEEGCGLAEAGAGGKEEAGGVTIVGALYTKAKVAIPSAAAPSIVKPWQLTL